MNLQTEKLNGVFQFLRPAAHGHRWSICYLNDVEQDV